MPPTRGGIAIVDCGCCYYTPSAAGGPPAAAQRLSQANLAKKTFKQMAARAARAWWGIAKSAALGLVVVVVVGASVAVSVEVAAERRHAHSKALKDGVWRVMCEASFNGGGEDTELHRCWWVESSVSVNKTQRERSAQPTLKLHLVLSA